MLCGQGAPADKGSLAAEHLLCTVACVCSVRSFGLGPNRLYVLDFSIRMIVDCHFPSRQLVNPTQDKVKQHTSCQSKHIGQACSHCWMLWHCLGLLSASRSGHLHSLRNRSLVMYRRVTLRVFFWWYSARGVPVQPSLAPTSTIHICWENLGRTLPLPPFAMYQLARKQTACSNPDAAACHCGLFRHCWQCLNL